MARATPISHMYLSGDAIKDYQCKIEERIQTLLGFNVECELSVPHVYALSCSIYRIRGIMRQQVSTIASFQLVEMPGCCGVLVSYHTCVSPKYREKGLASALHNIKLDMGRSMGYTMMMCTDIVGNDPQKKILRKNGWKRLAVFKNNRTTNHVSIYAKNLEP